MYNIVHSASNIGLHVCIVHATWSRCAHASLAYHSGSISHMQNLLDNVHSFGLKVSMHF